jgi:prolipoprotein diacylglyceryltransferase
LPFVTGGAILGYSVAPEVPHLTVRLAGRDRSSFRVCGVVGLVAAAGLAGVLARTQGLSEAVEGAIIVAAVLTFFVLALVTKVVTDREALIYYHHEIAVLLVAAATAAALGGPVLRHLDATALGLGAFLACGRVGCTLVGCCHGRPAARRGIRYGHAHVAQGFPAHLAGVPLVPVQAVEAGAVAALAATGAVVVAAGAAPGTGLVIYVTGYAVLRFGLELLRGDEARHAAAGLSEAQWTSLALLGVMAGAGALGWVPAAGTAELVALGVSLALLLPLALAEAHRPRGRVRSPAHVREIAEALERSRERESLTVATTSQGLRLSWGERDGIAHYTLSDVPRPAGPVAAELVRRLRHPGATLRLVPGGGSVLHVLIGCDERA